MEHETVLDAITHSVYQSGAAYFLTTGLLIGAKVVSYPDLALGDIVVYPLIAAFAVFPIALFWHALTKSY